MTESIEEKARERSMTPLWVIASFVSLTEVVTGIAVTQAQDATQVALVVFVVAFPVLVASAFFFVLWHRPYVLYPPTEYGSSTAHHRRGRRAALLRYRP